MKKNGNNPFILPIAREGWLIVGGFFVGAILLGLITPFFGVVGGIFTAWVFWFFRDSERTPPQQSENLVLAPCDGRILSIQKAPYPLGKAKGVRVSIEIGLTDAHVIRAPASGEVTESVYHPGAFINPTLDKASEHNERQSILISRKGGQEIAFTMIAGLVARRIVCALGEGAAVVAGDRVGFIRFGSRVDLFIPEIPLNVREGQTMVAGETVIASLPMNKKTPSAKAKTAGKKMAKTAAKTTKTTVKKTTKKKAKNT